MRRVITEAEVDRRVADQMARQRARGSKLPLSIVRGLARVHLEMTAAGEPAPVAPPPGKVAPRRPVAPVKPVAKPPAPVLEDRARMTRIIALTPRGREAECEEAIRSGMSVAEFEGLLAAREISESTARLRGR